jgi:hypothetical protein
MTLFTYAYKIVLQSIIVYILYVGRTIDFSAPEVKGIVS